MLKTVVLLVFLLACSLFAMSQTTAPSKVKALQEQKLDGTAEVFVHLGGKLMGELKSRLNMESDDSKKTTEPVKVIYDFGLFKMERQETRSVKKP